MMNNGNMIKLTILIPKNIIHKYDFDCLVISKKLNDETTNNLISKILYSKFVQTIEKEYTTDKHALNEYAIIIYHTNYMENCLKEYTEHEALRKNYNIFIDGYSVILYNYKCFSFGKSGIDTYNYPEIDKVLFDKDITEVIWKDGSETRVKRYCEDNDDREKALALAISKKVILGDGLYKNDNFNKEFQKYIDEAKEKVDKYYIADKLDISFHGVYTDYSNTKKLCNNINFLNYNIKHKLIALTYPTEMPEILIYCDYDEDNHNIIIGKVCTKSSLSKEKFDDYIEKLYIECLKTYKATLCKGDGTPIFTEEKDFMRMNTIV